MSHTNSPDQLGKLKNRLSTPQLASRQNRIRGRSLVAALLTGQNRQLSNAFIAFVQQGFWARFRWLFFGIGKKGI